ncbi:MAG TPA: hypothetical protein VNN73_02835 [Blastocatellia bacterium]|nr:hypothetical protein [Blastocatellia bacterium]
MTSRSVVVPFIVSLVAAPIVFAIALALSGPAEAEHVTLALFAATLVVEALAIGRAVIARRMFSPSDTGYATWTLIVLFLVVRMLVETRLATINFQLVPKYGEGSSSALFFYVVVLRYLYTVSDVLFITALANTIRAYKSTGLKFEMISRDYLYIALVWAIPALTFIFRDNLIYSNTAGTDNYIATFRLVTATVGAFIASLCIVVRRYVSQMGGGAVARVWTMVVIAGIARDGSFLALALLSKWWRPGAGFIEQYLLWIFACCWLIAALYQQEVLPRASKSELVTATAR